jgi:hypothetical protein
VTGSHHYPSLLQINTRVVLDELSRERGREIRLDEVPDSWLDRIVHDGHEWVWLLGVWESSPGSREAALRDDRLRAELSRALPDLSERDIVSSPFAVRGYTVDPALGAERLARLRSRLRERGLRLLLDFVPNHTAIDHPWAHERPELYVGGGEDDLAREPQSYLRLPTARGPKILAHGRDPYFPAWRDTLQLNYRHPALREAMMEELALVAMLCDGVRCDMAMLLVPEVIQRIWGDRSLPRDGVPPDDRPFWPEAIARVRRARPDFLFLAEVYWGMERALLEAGFDYAYDKELYDHLVARNAPAVRKHLESHAEIEARLARFLENHDEPRAAAVFPLAAHRAAAAITYLVPGLRFFHEGQLEGRRVRVPMQLGRRPAEPEDPEIRRFYADLLSLLSRPEVRHGSWRLLPLRSGSQGSATSHGFVAGLWRGAPGAGQGDLLVAVNYAPTRGQCCVETRVEEWKDRKIVLRDLLGPEVREHDGNDLLARGLHLDVPAWGVHAFASSVRR